MSGFEELGFSVSFGKVRGARVGCHPCPPCQVANGDTENSLAFMYRPAWRIIHTGGLSTASPRRARSISGSEEEPCFVFEGERLTKVRDKEEEEIRIERSRRRRRKRGGSVAPLFLASRSVDDPPDRFERPWLRIPTTTEVAQDPVVPICMPVELTALGERARELDSRASRMCDGIDASIKYQENTHLRRRCRGGCRRRDGLRAGAAPPRRARRGALLQC